MNAQGDNGDLSAVRRGESLLVHLEMTSGYGGDRSPWPLLRLLLLLQEVRLHMWVRHVATIQPLWGKSPQSPRQFPVLWQEQALFCFCSIFQLVFEKAKARGEIP